MASRTTRYTKGTFQMLWDCPSCGSKGLLGVDHRHCPNCGAVQEENLRYFPSPNQRVATIRRNQGPDVECSFCGTPCGGADNCCMNCGAPLKGTKQVHVRPSIPEARGETGADAQRDWDKRLDKVRRDLQEFHSKEARKAREAVRVEDLERAREDERRREEARHRAHAPSPPPPPRNPPLDYSELASSGFSYSRSDSTPGIVAAILIVSVILGMILLMTCRHEVEVTVEGHTWGRSIQVEKYTKIHDRDWRNDLPSDADIDSCNSEIHHYDQIPDGEDCTWVPESCSETPGSCSESCKNVDNGDGSFSVDCTRTCTDPVRTCTPGYNDCHTIYRDEPVWRDKCDYTVYRWKRSHILPTSGHDTNPFWSTKEINTCSHIQVGCERKGSQDGEYSVTFRFDGKSETCEYPQDFWSKLQKGKTYKASSNAFSSLICSSVQPVEIGKH